MTISKESSVEKGLVAFEGQQIFSFSFTTGGDKQLVVTVDGAIVNAYDTYFNMDGPGGAIAFHTPLHAGDVVDIYRDTVIDQQASFLERGPLPVKVLESGLDKLTRICQNMWDGLWGLREDVGKKVTNIISFGTGRLLGFKTDNITLGLKTLKDGTLLHSTESQDGTITLNVDAVNEAANLGAGVALFKGRVVNTLNFRTLGAGHNLSINPAGDKLVLNVDSVVNGMNVGTANNIFKERVGDTLTFKTVKAGSNVSIHNGQEEIRIDTIGESNKGLNVGGKNEVFKRKVGDALEFRTLTGVGHVSVVTVNDNILIGTAAEVNSAESRGGALELTLPKETGGLLPFKTIEAGSGVTITDGDDKLVIHADDQGGEANTVSTVGIGKNLFKQKVGEELVFKGIAAGQNIEVIDNADYLLIKATGTGSINHGANVGGEYEVFDGVNGDTLNFKTLKNGPGVMITEDADTLTIETTATGGTHAGTVSHGVNQGSGVGVFENINGDSMFFRTLVSGAGISVTEETGGEVKVENTAPSLVNKVSTGEALLDEGSYSIKKIDSTGRITVTPSANTGSLIIETTAEANNLKDAGVGSSLILPKANEILNIRKIIGGSNVTVTENGAALKIDVTDVMATSLYDPNANGIVDRSEKLVTVVKFSEDVTKGDILYSTGTVDNGHPVVGIADATVPAKRSAMFIAMYDGISGATDIVMQRGKIEGVDTSGMSAGDIVYLGRNGEFVEDPLNGYHNEVGIISHVGTGGVLFFNPSGIRTSGSNTGVGAGVYKGINNSREILMRRIKGGEGISVTENTNDISISSTLSAGDGVTLTPGVNGPVVDIEISGGKGVNVTKDSAGITVDASVADIVAGDNITVTKDPATNSVTIDVTGGDTTHFLSDTFAILDFGMMGKSAFKTLPNPWPGHMVDCILQVYDQSHGAGWVTVIGSMINGTAYAYGASAGVTGNNFELIGVQTSKYAKTYNPLESTFVGQQQTYKYIGAGDNGPVENPIRVFCKKWSPAPVPSGPPA